MNIQKMLMTVVGTLLCASCTTPPVVTPSKYPVSSKGVISPNNLPVIPVTFVFTTDAPQARQFDNLQQMHKEIQILNRYYVDDKNNKIFNFRFNNYISYTNFAKRNCNLGQTINRAQTINIGAVPASVEACFPRRKSKEVIVFIYNAYSTKQEFNDVTSRAFRNSGRPFVLLDWNRLNYNIQAGSVHEMGHVFGLKHVCVPKATKQTPTNIMASAECRRGSGGLRNLGFTQSQLQTIIAHYNRYP